MIVATLKEMRAAWVRQLRGSNADGGPAWSHWRSETTTVLGKQPERNCGSLDQTIKVAELGDLRFSKLVDGRPTTMASCSSASERARSIRSLLCCQRRPTASSDSARLADTSLVVNGRAQPS
jgi:hypothetical protein